MLIVQLFETFFTLSSQISKEHMLSKLDSKIEIILWLNIFLPSNGSILELSDGYISQ